VFFPGCPLQFGSWIFTLFVSGIGTAAVFAAGIYSPSKLEGAQVIYYEDQVCYVHGTEAYLHSYQI
jgi:hypothetical protein